MKYSFEYRSGNHFVEFFPDKTDEIYLNDISKNLTKYEILSELHCGDIRLLAYELISNNFKFLPEKIKTRIKIYD